MAKRAPTAADERDLYPRKTPPQGHPAAALAIPHHVEERGTGVVEGDELRQVRESRSPNERVGHVELRVDAVVADIGKIKGDIGELRGDVHGIRDMLERDLEERRFNRQLQVQTETNQVGLEKVRLTSRAKVTVAIIGLISAVLGIAGTLLVKAVS